MYIRRFQSAEEREAEGRAKGHERYANFLMSNVVCPRNRTGTDSSRRPIDAPNRAPQPNKLIPLELEREDPPASKVEARERWQTLMEYRFVDGLDLDFPYQAVDEDAENDDIEEQSRKLEDAYFSQEAAAFEVAEDQLNGQTGVQDY